MLEHDSLHSWVSLGFLPTKVNDNIGQHEAENQMVGRALHATLFLQRRELAHTPTELLLHLQSLDAHTVVQSDLGFRMVESISRK